jgi:hypothetical protein
MPSLQNVIFMIPANIPGYTEAYTRYFKLKVEGRLMKGDEPPRPEDYGLIAWAAEQVRKRIEREMVRPV